MMIKIEYWNKFNSNYQLLYLDEKEMGIIDCPFVDGKPDTSTGIRRRKSVNNEKVKYYMESLREIVYCKVPFSLDIKDGFNIEIDLSYVNEEEKENGFTYVDDDALKMIEELSILFESEFNELNYLRFLKRKKTTDKDIIN